MNSLRIVRAAARARPSIRTSFQRRSYADAVSDKIKLSLALPHQVCTSTLRNYYICRLDKIEAFANCMSHGRQYTNPQMCMFSILQT